MKFLVLIILWVILNPIFGKRCYDIYSECRKVPGIVMFLPGIDSDSKKIIDSLYHSSDCNKLIYNKFEFHYQIEDKCDSKLNDEFVYKKIKRIKEINAFNYDEMTPEYQEYIKDLLIHLMEKYNGGGISEIRKLTTRFSLNETHFLITYSLGKEVNPDDSTKFEYAVQLTKIRLDRAKRGLRTTKFDVFGGRKEDIEIFEIKKF